MTYITNNIIVMGNPVPKPSSSQNSLSDVHNYLNKYHPGAYMICNLTCSPTYDQSYFDYNVRLYPMNPNEPPPFRMIADFCIDIAGFLFSNSSNVVVIHCDRNLSDPFNSRKSINEGRTVLLVSCLLLFIRHPAALSAQDTIDLYTSKRLQLNKSENFSKLNAALALLTPSQMRWVRIFERYMREYFWRGLPFPSIDQEIRIKSIKCFPSADFDPQGGCDPFVVIRYPHTKAPIYNSKDDKQKISTHSHWNGDKPYKCEFSAPVTISGEVEISLYDSDMFTKDDLMFKIWLQTSFIGSNVLMFTKKELDFAALDWRCEHFPEDFTCLIEFENLNNTDGGSSGVGINDFIDQNEADNLLITGALAYPPVEISSIDLKDAAHASAKDTIAACTKLARILPSHCKPKNKKSSKNFAANEDEQKQAELLNTYGSANFVQLRRLGVNIDDMEESEEEMRLYSDTDDDDDDVDDFNIHSSPSSPTFEATTGGNISDIDNSTSDEIYSSTQNPLLEDGDTSNSKLSLFVAPSSPNLDKVNTDEENKSKSAWSLTNVARKLVSKKKKRFQKDGFNLDLTYIAPTIIAMGFPSEGLESTYRNSMTDVQKFLQYYHDGHYKVYNLCSEKKYNPNKFQKMARYPFDDHNPCSLQLLYQFCQDAGNFLQADPENIVAIHCKAGKGRTGLMIAALLIYMQAFDTSLDSLRFYGHQRTSNLKGVTIPSQQRFVTYFEMFVRHYLHAGLVNAFPFRGVPIVIKKIILRPYANFDRGGGCTPFFTVTNLSKTDIYNHKSALSTLKQKPRQWRADGSQPEFVIDVLSRVEIASETKFTFYDYDVLSSPTKMFHFWILPTFMYGLLVGPNAPSTASITLTKPELDKAVKDRKCTKFPHDFSCEIVFAKPENSSSAYY